MTDIRHSVKIWLAGSKFEIVPTVPDIRHQEMHRDARCTADENSWTIGLPEFRGKTGGFRGILGVNMVRQSTRYTSATYTLVTDIRHQEFSTPHNTYLFRHTSILSFMV